MHNISLHRALALGMGLVWLAAAPLAQATVVLDQFNIPPPTSASAPVTALTRVGTFPAQGVSVTTFAVQTITAGQRGELDRIDLLLAQFTGLGLTPGFLTIELFDGDFFANPLALSFHQSDIPTPFLPTIPSALNNQQFTTINLAGSGYRVQPGQIFSVVFSHQLFTGTSGYAVLPYGSVSVPPGPGQPPAVTNYSQYAGGSLRTLAITPGGVVGPTTLPGDMGFRTYVNTAVVPEPATWAMLILGFGVIGAALRRRAARDGQRSTP